MTLRMAPFAAITALLFAGVFAGFRPIQSCRETIVLCPANYTLRCTEYDVNNRIIREIPQRQYFGYRGYSDLVLITSTGDIVYTGSDDSRNPAVYSSTYGTVTPPANWYIPYGSQLSIYCGINGTFVVGGYLVSEGNIKGEMRAVYPGIPIKRIVGTTNGKYIVATGDMFNNAEDKIYVLDGDEVVQQLQNPPMYAIMICNSKTIFAVVSYYAIGIYSHDYSLISTMIQGSPQHPWKVVGCAPRGMYVTRDNTYNLTSVEYYEL